VKIMYHLSLAEREPKKTASKRKELKSQKGNPGASDSSYMPERKDSDGGRESCTTTVTTYPSNTRSRPMELSRGEKRVEHRAFRQSGQVCAPQNRKERSEPRSDMRGPPGGRSTFG